MIVGFTKEEETEFTAINCMAFQQKVKEDLKAGREPKCWLNMTGIEKHDAMHNFKISMENDGLAVEYNVDLMLLLQKKGIENSMNVAIEKWKKSEMKAKELVAISGPCNRWKTKGE